MPMHRFTLQINQESFNDASMWFSFFRFSKISEIDGDVNLQFFDEFDLNYP